MRNEVGAEEGKMKERNGVTVKTAGGTAKVDRGEEKERKIKTTRGTTIIILLVLRYSCLGRVFLDDHNSSDWMLGVVYLKSARRF